MRVAPSFDFATSRPITFQVETEAPGGGPLAYHRVEISAGELGTQHLAPLGVPTSAWTMWNVSSRRRPLLPIV